MANLTPPKPYTASATHGPDNIVLPVEHTLKSFSVEHACPGPPPTDEVVDTQGGAA